MGQKQSYADFGFCKFNGERKLKTIVFMEQIFFDGLRNWRDSFRVVTRSWTDSLASVSRRDPVRISNVEMK